MDCNTNDLKELADLIQTEIHRVESLQRHPQADPVIEYLAQALGHLDSAQAKLVKRAERAARRQG